MGAGATVKLDILVAECQVAKAKLKDIWALGIKGLEATCNLNGTLQTT